MNAVVSILSHQQYLEVLATKEKLVIIDFTASWCGPCKVISPIFHALAAQYPNVLFASLDVDEVSESAAMAGVSAMPTFQFHRDGRKIHEMKGANKDGLELIVQQLAGKPIKSAPVEEVVLGQIDLKPFISGQLECLNSDLKFPVQNAFSDNDDVLKSDADEQMILGITFTQPVKVHSIKIISHGAGPKNIKTFVNQVNTIGFDEVDVVNATEEIELTEQDLQPLTKPRGLKFVKYQNVHKLTIFIADNQTGEDVTEIKRVILYGTPIDATKDISELKKMGHDH